MLAIRVILALIVCLNVVMGFSLPSTATATDKKPTPTLKLDTITGEQQDAEVARLLEQEQFAELEHYARDLIARKARFADGRWRIYRFFEKLRDPYASNNSWEQYIARLERWRAAFPDSAISQTALVRGLYDWAETARGNATADKVTDEGWQKFKDRLARAWVVLEQPVKGKDCPVLHTFRFMVAILLNQPEEAIEKAYAAATAAEPQSYYNILFRAKFLQPKWGGQPGQWARFIRQEMAHLDQPDRDCFVARFAGNMVRNDMTYEEILTEFPWETLKPSFEKLVYTYKTPAMRNYFLRFACYTKDYEVVLRENSILGNNVKFENNWRWNKKIYDICIKQVEAAHGQTRTK